MESSKKYLCSLFFLFFVTFLTHTPLACAADADVPLIKRPRKPYADSLYVAKAWRLQVTAFAEVYFDNKEFAQSTYQPSGTIFNTQIVPRIGFAHENPSGSETSITLGANFNIAHGLNSSKLPTFKLQAFVTHKYKFFTGIFGVMPGGQLGKGWITACFSDDFRFKKPNVAGTVLVAQKENFSYRLGLDWMGAWGPATQRERFLVFSNGCHDVLPWLSVGYNVFYYHLACSEEIEGVVDNAMLYPYVGFHALKYPWTLDFNIGYIQTLQRDRTVTRDFLAPGGGYAEQHFGWKGIYLKNTIYYGKGLMPYYSYTDNLGTPYGDLLYHGDPFYNFEGTGLYDCLTVGYGRTIIPGLSFEVLFRFHFHSVPSAGGTAPAPNNSASSGYSGCNQLFRFTFDARLLK